MSYIKPTVSTENHATPSNLTDEDNKDYLLGMAALERQEPTITLAELEQKLMLHL